MDGDSSTASRYRSRQGKAPSSPEVDAFITGQTVAVLFESCQPQRDQLNPNPEKVSAFPALRAAVSSGSAFYARQPAAVVRFPGEPILFGPIARCFRRRMRTESDKQRIQIAQYGTIQVQHNVSDSVDQLQHDTDSNSLSERTIAFLALLAVQLGFGCYGVMLKPWGDTLDPLLFNLLRDCGTCMLLLYAASLHEPGGILIPPPEDHLLFAAMGVLGMFGAQVSYVVAVSLSGPAVCALYTPLVPVVTTMLAVCTGMESLIPCTMPNAFKSGGIIISAAGALVMVAAADSGQQAAVESQSAANTFWGNVLMLFQVFCTSSFHLMQQRFIYQVHKDDARGARWSQRPICLTAWAYGSGSVVMAVVALPYSYIRPEFVDFDASGLIPLTYSILVASCMCYTLMTYANRVLSATIATAFWPLQVLVATTMARTCYGEALTQVEIMAGCLIVVGMFCIVWSSSMPTIETVHSET